MHILIVEDDTAIAQALQSQFARSGYSVHHAATLQEASHLIEQSAVDEFRPENYHDTVRERVLEAIQQKVKSSDCILPGLLKSGKPDPEVLETLCSWLSATLR